MNFELDEPRKQTSAISAALEHCPDTDTQA